MISLGDRLVGSTIRFLWPVAGLNGAGIVRSTDGTVVVYKDGGVTQSSTGVTDTDNFDSQAGLNLCVIDTSADGTLYSSGSDFDVVLLGATIDGQAGVNTVLAHFTLGMIQAVIDAIKAKTDNLPSDPADASVVSSEIAALDAKIDIIDANVDAVLVDTGTTLQAELDGIQADTEDIQARLPAALHASGNIKAQVLGIVGETLQGDGTLGNEWRPV